MLRRLLKKLSVVSAGTLFLPLKLAFIEELSLNMLTMAEFNGTQPAV
jgi:hypothetical protein